MEVSHAFQTRPKGPAEPTPDVELVHNAMVAILAVFSTDRCCLGSPGQVNPFPAARVPHASDVGGLSLRLSEHEVETAAVAGTYGIPSTTAVTVVPVTLTSSPVEEECNLGIHHACIVT